MGYGQTAGGFQPRESMCMLERMGCCGRRGVRRGVDCKLQNCTMIALTRPWMIRSVMRGDASELKQWCSANLGSEDTRWRILPWSTFALRRPRADAGLFGCQRALDLGDGCRRDQTIRPPRMPIPSSGMVERQKVRREPQTREPRTHGRRLAGVTPGFEEETLSLFLPRRLCHLDRPCLQTDALS